LGSVSQAHGPELKGLLSGLSRSRNAKKKAQN